MPYRNTLWPSRKEVRALLIHSLGAALSAPLTFKMCSTPLSCRQPVPVLTELPLQIKGLRQFGIQELLHLLCVRVLSSKQSGANLINSVLGFFLTLPCPFEVANQRMGVRWLSTCLVSYASLSSVKIGRDTNPQRITRNLCKGWRTWLRTRRFRST